MHASRNIVDMISDFHQSCSTDAFWIRHEGRLLGHEVKVQGHGGIKYAENSTLWGYLMSASSSEFPVICCFYNKVFG